MALFFKKKDFLGSVEYIVAGLGNPDRQYEKTRHNAGFTVIDRVCERLNIELKSLKFKSYCKIVEINNKKVLLMKPQTYMNNSGEAVVEAMNFYKVPPQKTVIIFDDISLDVGKMRVKRKGSDGGQRGMRSIIYLSGSDLFPRIKIGIGQKPEKWDLKDWVLSKFSSDEYNQLTEVCDNAYTALTLMLDDKIDEAMNRFN